MLLTFHPINTNWSSRSIFKASCNHVISNVHLNLFKIKNLRQALLVSSFLIAIKSFSSFCRTLSDCWRLNAESIAVRFRIFPNLTLGIDLCEMSVEYLLPLVLCFFFHRTFCSLLVPIGKFNLLLFFLQFGSVCPVFLSFSMVIDLCLWLNFLDLVFI